MKLTINTNAILQTCALIVQFGNLAVPILQGQPHGKITLVVSLVVAAAQAILGVWAHQTLPDGSPAAGYNLAQGDRRSQSEQKDKQ